MKQASAQLLNELTTQTQRQLEIAKEYLELSDTQLNAKPAADSWSALECLEHLNRYCAFYVPEIGQRMDQSRHAASGVFRSSWLGNYFAQSMIPKEKGGTMKTFKSMNPAGSALDYETIQQFIQYQEDLLDLLHRARQTDLSRVKTSISISSWIKLRLGDTFRVVIYHQDRHIQQADRALMAAQ